MFPKELLNPFALVVTIKRTFEISKNRRLANIRIFGYWRTFEPRAFECSKKANIADHSNIVVRRLVAHGYSSLPRNAVLPTLNGSPRSSVTRCLPSSQSCLPDKSTNVIIFILIKSFKVKG